MNKLPRLIAPILLAVLGLGLGGVAIFSIFLSFRDTGTSIVAPGETTVTITKPGKYTLWHESKTMIDGQILRFPDDLPSGVTIRFSTKTAGTNFPFNLNNNASSESGGIRRVSVGNVTFPTPGDYQVTVTGLTEKRMFYLDEANFFRLFFRGVLLGLCGILALILSIGWGIYVLVQKPPQEPAFHP